MNDPKKKKDCQDRIDRIIAKKKAAPIICPQCGAGMTVFFAGELHDKRAKCPYCGTEVDLPDTYSRTTIETKTGSGILLPETKVAVIERSTDNQVATITSGEIEQVIMEKGVIAGRKELEARGIKGLKLDGFTGVEQSSEANKILEEQGLQALGKSQGAIVMTPKQVNSVFKGVLAFFVILPIIVIIILLVRFFLK